MSFTLQGMLRIRGSLNFWKEERDCLLMLKGKTQGNLAAEEAKALEDFIYELQMRYVAKEKSISK